MKNINLTLRILLILIFSLSYNLSYAGWLDEYKNELHTNRLALKDNAIWIVASKGLVKYDKALETVSSASDELGVNSNIEYLSIATAPDNSLWFASEDMGIQKYNGQVSDYFAGDTRSLYGFYYAFAFDSQGRVFSGEMEHIFYVDNLIPIDQFPYCKQLFILATSGIPACSGRPVMDMAFDSNDNLWILSDNHNAYYDDGENGFATLVKKSKAGINEALKDIGYNYSYKLIYPEPILEFDEIYSTSLVVDNEDNIWFTADDGIHYYNQVTGVDSLINHTTHSEIPNEHFYIAEKDSNGNIWFSSSTTLLKYSGTKFSTYTCSNYNEARAILCDGNIVWVLLKNDKLLKYQSRKFKVIDLSPALTGINESIAEAPKAKAFVSNGVLNIENAEGINSVMVYDAMGKVITSANANGATSTQIALPSNTKGLLIVKINNDVVKVICD